MLESQIFLWFTQLFFLTHSLTEMIYKSVSQLFKFE